MEIIKGLFITSVFNLKIPIDLGNGIEIGKEMKITNNKQFIFRLLSNNLKENMGKLEVSSIIGNGCVIYSNSFESNNKSPSEKLNHFLNVLDMFYQALWFIKDNSVWSEVGFIEYEYSNKQLAVSSDFIPNIYSFSNGERNAMIFTKEELDKSIEIFHRFIYAEGLNEKSLLKKETDKASRAIYFIKTARVSQDLAVKIFNYCIGLETLFLSSSSTEITYKLCERIAFLIGESPEERKRIFLDIKEIYTVRSKVVHGDVLKKNKLEQLRNTSSKCDLYSRKLFQKMRKSSILRDELEKKESIENFFIDLMFGLISLR